MITRWNLNELYHDDNELYHHGVLGMRWGHRKQEYRTNSDRRRAIAKRVAIGAGVAAAVAGGAVLARRNGVNPLRAVRSKLSRSPKPGTVSKVSATLAEKRFDPRIGASLKTARTPTINGLNKRVAYRHPDGVSNMKRLIAKNGNVKVSKIDRSFKTMTPYDYINSRISGGSSASTKRFLREGSGMNTPILRSSSRFSKSKVPNTPSWKPDRNSLLERRKRIKAIPKSPRARGFNPHEFEEVVYRDGPLIYTRR